jgi:SAM domain (Sterile alpha motif)
VEHEIDLELFKTLTENELRDLGIHAFGVRRRMLLTIAGKHQLLSIRW